MNEVSHYELPISYQDEHLFRHRQRFTPPLEMVVRTPGTSFNQNCLLCEAGKIDYFTCKIIDPKVKISPYSQMINPKDLTNPIFRKLQILELYILTETRDFNFLVKVKNVNNHHEVELEFCNMKQPDLSEWISYYNSKILEKYKDEE